MVYNEHVFLLQSQKYTDYDFIIDETQSLSDSLT